MKEINEFIKRIVDTVYSEDSELNVAEELGNIIGEIEDVARAEALSIYAADDGERIMLDSLEKIGGKEWKNI